MTIMSELLDKSRSLRSCRKRGAKVKQLPESQQNASRKTK